MRSKLLLSTAAVSLVLGTAGYGLAQDRSSDDAKMKQEIQKLEQNKTKTDKTSGQATPSDTSKQSNPPSSASSDTSKSADSPKSANDTTKPAASQSSQSGQSKPSTASDTSKSQPSTASDTTKSQPSTASDTTKSQPSTASDTTKSQPSTSSDANKSQPSTAQQPTQNQNAATPSTNMQANTAQSQPATRVSASLQASQKTQLTQAFAKVSVKPVSNVNFSVSVGTVVPTTVTLHPVPATVITIVPQYRGYDFFIVRDEFIIVEPRTHKIVDVIERSGGGGRAATTTTTTRKKVDLSQKDRAFIREHSTTRRTTTTGAAARGETHIIVGEDAPEAVEIEEFPADVYRRVPAVRSYRYIHSGSGVYLVEPGSRRVIESIGED